VGQRPTHLPATLCAEWLPACFIQGSAPKEAFKQGGMLREGRAFPWSRLALPDLVA
jgi:hypothetical protein